MKSLLLSAILSLGLLSTFAAVPARAADAPKPCKCCTCQPCKCEKCACCKCKDCKCDKPGHTCGGK